ncbi:hypothetical protein HYH02_012312 [Chlamydomonas schloesseri]|uniref:Uncharacterized protein n=1 Tax=Chlamydomonas schloesseri TaxID=2026947 RepID=A0A835SWN8_9CHLO|nr:hypothetical protein HYH02_012312 [Chlamydomonas schloesseri]|eukprot:KAG2434483.1 hypothetical protein HYH02_012312 [Chlamydomonas schloesseri]
MTRTKASQAPRAGAKDENEPPKKHAGEASKQATGRQSREVLLLLNTAVLDITSGGAAGGRARGRTSVADVKAEPQQQEPAGRGKKGHSAPPAPELPVAASQQPEPEVLDARRADAVAKKNKKRAVGTAAGAPAAEPESNVADRLAAAAEDAANTQEHGAKKRKVSRSSDSGKAEGKTDPEVHQANKPKQKSSGSASAAAAFDAADVAAANAAPVHVAAEKKRTSKGSGDGKAANEGEAGAVSRHGRPPAGSRASHDGSVAPASDSGASQAAAGSGAAAGKQQGTKRQTEKAASKAAAAVAAVGGYAPSADGVGNAAAAAGPSGANTAAVQTVQLVVQAEAGAGAKRAKKPEAAPAPALHTAAVEPPQPAPQAPAAPTAPAAAVAAAVPAPVPAGRAAVAAGAGATTPSVGAVSAGAAGTARQLPVTGTTPVKIVPMPMPRMDEVGQRERSAVVELQRQLAELRGMYDELKSTKIQELEKVLAEQMQNTEEQVRLAEQRAKLWQAAAEHAEQKAKAAGSEEVASRIAGLEAQVQQLLAEKGELLLRVAQQERELAQAQQAAHDMRAELMLLHQSLDGKDEPQEEEGEGRAQQQGGAEGGTAGDPMDVDGAGVDGRAAQGPSAQEACGTGATPCDGVVAAGRRGPHLPSLSPNAGVLFPTPGTQLVRLRGLLSSGLAGQPSGETPSAGPGVSTECLRIVNMLPSLRAVSAEDGSTAPVSGAATGGTGLNTHCQRVVNMLPQLRAPTPSIQSRLASGAVPLALQSEAAAAAGAVEGTTVAGATPGPSVANGADQPAAGNKSRRSNGSPIDGICGADQRKAGAQAAPAATTATAADMSFAHGMGAPEAFHLPARQQDQYSFVDLNPASVRKGPRSPEGPLSAAAQVAFAAATALPRSPVAAAQARSPLPPRASPRLLSPSGRTPIQAPNLAGFSPRAAAAAAIAAARAALAVDSGNVSNQGSCSGLVARAAAQQDGAQPPQQHEADAATGGDGSATAAQGNNGTPMSACKRQPTPSADAAGAVEGQAAPAAELQPALSPANNNGGQAHAAGPGTPPSPHAAKLVMYEQLLDWHAEAVSLSPPVCRLTHLGSGASIELRETELDEDELADLEEAGGGAVEGGAAAAAVPAVRPVYVQYTPLQLGALGQYLPEFYQDEFKVPAENRRALLEGLDKAIKEALQQQQQPAA